MAGGKLEFCKEIPKQSTEEHGTTRYDDSAFKASVLKAIQLTSSERAGDKQADVQGTAAYPQCQTKCLKKWVSAVVTY